MMRIALDNFIKVVDPSDRKLIFIVMDQAGWHMRKKPKVPINVIIIPLPPYTPELSPAEPLIKKLKISIANKTFLDIQEAGDVIESECRRMIKSAKEIKSLTLLPLDQ